MLGLDTITNKRSCGLRLPTKLTVFEINETGMLGVGLGEAGEEVLLQLQVLGRTFDGADTSPECLG